MKEENKKPRVIGFAFFETEKTMAEKFADKYKISPSIDNKILVMQVLKRSEEK